MRKNLLLILVMLIFVVIVTMGASNPDFNPNQTAVTLYDAGDDVTIYKNNFIWVYNSTGYVDSDSGTSSSDVFAGLAANTASYTAAQSAYSMKCWMFASYQPVAGLWNADAANVSGVGGAIVYWDAGTYTNTSGAQTLALTLDGGSGANRPIGFVEKVVTAASKLYRIRVVSDYMTNRGGNISGIDVYCADLYVADDATIGDDLAITGDITAVVGISTSGAVSVGTTLGVTGLTTATGGIITNDIDTLTGTTLLLGKSTSTKLELADTGVETEIQGTLDVHEDANFVTGVITGVKDIITTGCGQVVAEDNFPWNDVTETEAAAAFAKCYDEGTTAYVNLSVAGGSAEYAANYQLFPDTETVDDAVYFGAAVAFGCIDTDCGSGTAGVYADDSITWEYYNGSAWAALTIVYDFTDSTANDGLRPFQVDGHLLWTAPSDWAAVEVDSQSAYWVRARVTAAQITTIPITNAHEHFLTSIDSGTKVPYACTVSRGRFNFETTSGANNDTKVILYNYTTSTCSALSTLTKAKKDPTVANFNLAVAADDVIAFFVAEEDGTTEYAGGTCELTVTR